MIPRPLQVGAGEQRRPMGDRQNGLPHMATRGAQPQMAPPTYAQVAQMPPRQALQRSVEETRCRQEITCNKRAAETPRAVDAPRAAPRAQGLSISISDLQPGPEVLGTSHLLDDLRRYVSLLVRQYVEKRLGDLRKSGPTTDSPILDTDMLEEDRLAWQELATSAQLRKTPDEDHPMLGDIDTTGNDWEPLDVEDFPMEEAEPKQDLSTDRQIHQRDRDN